MSHGRIRCQYTWPDSFRCSQALAARLDFPIPGTPRTTKTRGMRLPEMSASSSLRRPTKVSVRGASARRATKPSAGDCSTLAMSTTFPSITADTSEGTVTFPGYAWRRSPIVVARTPAASLTRTVSRFTCSRRRPVASCPGSVR